MKKIRSVNIEDAKALLSIYSPFILNSGITQEAEVPSEENFQQRIQSTLKERPWLVCEIENEIAGYAYAGRHRERTGYQWCIEPSVYVADKFHNCGVAYALYTAMFEILRIQGFVNAYAVITLPNDKSVSFHEKFGFRYLTTFKKIGFKLNQWHDVGWWELEINPHVLSPGHPVNFSGIDRKQVDVILQTALQLLKK